MRETACVLLSVLSIAGASRMAAQSELSPAFFKTWRIKPDQSMTTIIFSADGDATRISVGPNYYSFKYDGKGYPMSNEGYSAYWKRLDNRTLASEIKANGEVMIRTNWAVSSDGRHMTVTHRFKNSAAAANIFYERNSPANADDPFLGTWRLPDSAGYEALTLELAGRTIRTISSCGAGYTAALDNQDHPVASSHYPPGTTVALRRIGEFAYEENWKHHGAPFATSRFALSPGGAILTQTWTNLRPHANNEQPRVVIYGQ